MAKPLNIGDLNRRIDIQTETATRGASGQEILSWETLASVFAKVEMPGTGNSESIDGNQVIVQTRADFTIRYREGIDEKMRIVYRSSNYGITNISEFQSRNQYLKIQAYKIE